MLNINAGALTPVLYPHTSTVVNTQPAETAIGRPCFTQVPHIVYDQYLHALSGAETKVLNYINRRTLGFGKMRDSISLSQFAKGIVTKAGYRLDYGTGLAESTVQKSLNSLVAKGIIGAERQYDERGAYVATVYWIILDSRFGLVDGDEIADPTVSESVKPLHRSTSSRFTDSRGYKKQSPKKEVYKKERQQHIPAELQVAEEEKPEPVQSESVVVPEMNNEELETVHLLVTETISAETAKAFVVKLGSPLTRAILQDYRKRRAEGKAQGTGRLIRALQHPEWLNTSPTATKAQRFNPEEPFANPEPSRQVKSKLQQRELEPTPIKPRFGMSPRVTQRMQELADRAATPAQTV